MTTGLSPGPDRNASRAPLRLYLYSLTSRRYYHIVFPSANSVLFEPRRRPEGVREETRCVLARAERATRILALCRLVSLLSCQAF